MAHPYMCRIPKVTPNTCSMGRSTIHDSTNIGVEGESPCVCPSLPVDRLGGDRFGIRGPVDMGSLVCCVAWGCVVGIRVSECGRVGCTEWVYAEVAHAFKRCIPKVLPEYVQYRQVYNSTFHQHRGVVSGLESPFLGECALGWCAVAGWSVVVE